MGGKFLLERFHLRKQSGELQKPITFRNALQLHSYIQNALESDGSGWDLPLQKPLIHNNYRCIIMCIVCLYYQKFIVWAFLPLFKGIRSAIEKSALVWCIKKMLTISEL